MKFTKMHGAGNDYVYVNCFDEPIPEDAGALAIAVSHRRFGVGADGLILICPSQVADVRMQMLNADGSVAEMCGNGIRCAAKYVYDHGIAAKETLQIETDAGILALRLSPGRDGLIESVSVNLGQPELEAALIPTTVQTKGRVIDQEIKVDGQVVCVTCVSMGNPHCVIFVPEATDELVLGLGPKIETDERFPNRVNVEFVEVISPVEVRQRTWERGSGETWACGTGAAAVCVAGVLTGKTENRILNHLLGGDLSLHWDNATNHVHMTGGAVEVFSGEWNG